MCGEEGRGSQEPTVEFRRRLADLKRNGCNVLLVGTDALDAACERLLGESSAGPRYRLFVTADERPATAHAKLARVQSGPYRDSAAVVDWNADVRGSVATDGPDSDDSFETGPGVRDSDGPAFRETTVESDDLADLGSVVEDLVETFSAESGSLSPAELRLCFDSLTPVIADYDEAEIRRFLGDLTETVERVDGMAHYHLPAEYDSETVASVEHMFDAVVEVRRTDGGVEQRWHLTDPDITTRWLSL
jgi:hypothetical protein